MSICIKVSAHSRPAAVAGSIAHSVRAENPTHVQTIGAGAANQALKALILARSYLHAEGIRLAVVPAFARLDVEGESRTGLRLEVVRWEGNK